MSTLAEERVQFEAALLDLFEGFESGSGGVGSIITPTRLNAINYVKAKLDELIPEGEGISFSLSTSPNISDPYNMLINANLDEATKDVILSAPLSVLCPVAFSGTTGNANTDAKTGYIVLPLNFLRLSSFKMAEWQREIMDAITPQHPLYKRQANQFLRGGTIKPVAVLNWKNNNDVSSGLREVDFETVETVYTPNYPPGENILTLVQDGASGGTVSVVADETGKIVTINGIVTPGTGYSVSDSVATTGSTGSGFKIAITKVIPAYELRRILEYYSVESSHSIDKLMYIPEMLAEDFLAVNPNLLDALAWMCAAKILQIIGMYDAAKMAMEQVTLSYSNLL